MSEFHFLLILSAGLAIVAALFVTAGLSSFLWRWQQVWPRFSRICIGLGFVLLALAFFIVSMAPGAGR